MRWCSLDISESNFAKKCRRKKPSQQQNIVPANIATRHCVSKMSEIFDLTSKITLITSTIKLDLHTLVKRGFDWDKGKVKLLDSQVVLHWLSNHEKVVKQWGTE